MAIEEGGEGRGLTEEAEGIEDDGDVAPEIERESMERDETDARGCVAANVEDGPLP